MGFTMRLQLHQVPQQAVLLQPQGVHNVTSITPVLQHIEISHRVAAYSPGVGWSGNSLLRHMCDDENFAILMGTQVAQRMQLPQIKDLQVVLGINYVSVPLRAKAECDRVLSQIGFSLHQLPVQSAI